MLHLLLDLFCSAKVVLRNTSVGGMVVARVCIESSPLPRLLVPLAVRGDDGLRVWGDDDPGSILFEAVCPCPQMGH